MRVGRGGSRKDGVENNERRAYVLWNTEKLTQNKSNKDEKGNSKGYSGPKPKVGEPTGQQTEHWNRKSQG